jgi:formylglycine-generating enzyme
MSFVKQIGCSNFSNTGKEIFGMENGLSKNFVAMEKIMYACLFLVLFSSCGGGNRGQLLGVQDREEWYMDDPYGMLYIPMGSYNMGPSDQDVPYAMTTQAKTVSVQAFYMDETEITNNEYRQFTNWVRDSIAHLLIGEDHILEEGECGEMRSTLKF